MTLISNFIKLKLKQLNKSQNIHIPNLIYAGISCKYN